MSLESVLLTLLLGGVVLWRNLPGALLCLSPALVRVRKGSLEDPRVDHGVLCAMEEELGAIGFEPIGVHFEQAPLRRAVLHYDFASPEEATFASAFFEGRYARLYLLTEFEDGALVLTADHVRAGIEREGYLAGGIPGATPEELLAAHRRRVERLRQTGRVPRKDLSVDGRVEAGRRWFSGKGARELRVRHANGLLLTLIGVVILSAVFGGALKR